MFALYECMAFRKLQGYWVKSQGTMTLNSKLFSRLEYSWPRTLKLNREFGHDQYLTSIDSEGSRKMVKGYSDLDLALGVIYQSG